jgi:8-oxo-dGTP pyrophosphatase MutT (NUDIX family)
VGTSIATTASSPRAGKAATNLAHPAVRQQVAAVCYRTGTRGIEFLLVRTRGGRWIFPKGGVEPGLTQAQSAALEAFEEAGVHGRIEEMPFARYHLEKSAVKTLTCDKSKSKKSIRRKSNARPTKRSRSAAPAADGETVTAHLCEVSHLEAPEEAHRTPTWFSREKAKRRLLENRDDELGAELACIVDRALSRIRRLEASASKEFQSDALRKVHFEASDGMFSQAASAAAVVQRLLIESRRLRPANVVDIEATPVISKRKKNYVQ